MAGIVVAVFLLTTAQVRAKSRLHASDGLEQIQAD
jgi:hypothetical protein